jgi:hypothetical protein
MGAGTGTNNSSTPIPAEASPPASLRVIRVYCTEDGGTLVCDEGVAGCNPATPIST